MQILLSPVVFVRENVKKINSPTAFVGETDCRAAGRLLPNSYI